MVQNAGNGENTQGYENVNFKNVFPKGLNFLLNRSYWTNFDKLFFVFFIVKLVSGNLMHQSYEIKFW